LLWPQIATCGTIRLGTLLQSVLVCRQGGRAWRRSKRLSLWYCC
jgi:hypothetical protein